MIRRLLPAAWLLVLALSAAAEDPVATMMSAAYNGSLSDVRAAVKHGANINALDEDGESALMYAVSGGHDDIIRFLLQNGAGVDSASSRGDTALFYAALKERPSAARLLLDGGAGTEIKNQNGATPLVVAASHGSLETAKVLLERGADINARGTAGATPLMTAILDGQPKVAQLLIEKGADVNARDEGGSTALIMAAFNGRTETARLLIDKRADVYAADAHSETALEYAKASGSTEIEAMIEKVLSLGSADQERLRRQELERQARLRADEAAKDAARAELARQTAERQQRYLLYAAAGALLILIAGFLKYSADARRRKAMLAKQKETAVRNILALATADADRGYEALRAYEKEYRDISVFPADALLRLYEARDRAKQATPEKIKRRADAQSKADALTRVRGLVESDPRGAYTALQGYVADHGDASPFTGAELGRLYELAGRDGELLTGSLRLTDAQAVGLAAYLSERGRSEAAIRLVSAEPLLSATIRVDGGCDSVIGIYDKAGALQAFLELCAGKSHEFQTTYARAFLAQGRPADALKLMTLVRVKDHDDQAVIAAALIHEGKNDEALKVIEDIPKASWSFVGWSAFFQFCLKTGRWEEAHEALDHVRLLRPLRRDPKLHHDLGLASEAAGRADMAGEIFHAFVRAGLPYRDAFQRAARLPPPPEEVRRPSEPDAAQASGTRIGGRYDLRSELGKGDLGTVYAAYDSKNSRKVALKKVRAEIAGDAKERARFLHQAKLVSRLDHPAVIGVREIIDEAGDIYLVFDFAEGSPLSAVLEQKKRLSLMQSKTLLEPVCQALDHGHLRNVLHQTLSPANIMVGPDGRGKVMDFGLARPGRAPDAYAAPEAHGGHFSRASDVYSIGVCLFQMATGKLPFSGPEMLEQKKARKVAPVRTLLAELPRELDALFASALEPDPKERITDALEFFAELKRLSVL